MPSVETPWNRFRGSNGTGVGSVRGLPTEISRRVFAWECPLPGEGHSSPVVHRNHVFVTAAVESSSSAFLVCVDAVTGKMAWKADIPYPKASRHRFNAAASSTPVVTDAGINVLAADTEQSRLLAFDIRGNLRWERDLGPLPTQHGGGASPVSIGKRVVVAISPDHRPGVLWCLDSRTGKTIWRKDQTSRDAPYSTPCFRRGQRGEELVFSSTSGGVWAIDPSSGAECWAMRDLFRERCVGSPIETPYGIVATSGSGGGERKAVMVMPPTKENVTPTVAWTLSRGTSYVPTPLLASDTIVFWGDNGVVTGVDPRNGQILWQQRAGGNYFASPVVADGRVWNLSAEGDLVWFSTGPAPTEFHRHPMGQGSHATIAFGSGRMFVRTHGRLLCIAGKAA